MGPGQEGLEHILATAIRELRQLLASSDARIHRLIGEGHEALARGQAATVYLRREAFNLPAVREIAAGLLASDASLSWLDRLAICVSWTKHIPLFDAGLTSTPIQDAELTANAHAWRAIDQAVTLLEHFAGTEKDLREGVTNVACLQANLPARLLEPIPVQGYDPDERQAVCDKASECLVRAVREGVEGGGPREEYLFLALMTPIIIFAFSRTPAEQADAFLETLSPALRAMAEQATLVQEVGIPAWAGLPGDVVLATRVPGPHAADLPNVALDAAPMENSFVDAVEHGAHRRRRHPVEVSQVRVPRARLDFETTEVPLLRIDDRRSLGQGAQGHVAGELASDRRERRGGGGEHRANEGVAPVSEPCLHQLKQFRARVDRDPGVLRELPQVDRPRSDRALERRRALGFSEGREDPQDAGPSNLRDEPDVGGAASGCGNEPAVGAVAVA